MKLLRQFPVGLLTSFCITLTAHAQATSQFELQAPPAIFGLSLARALTADVDGDRDLDVVGLGPLALVRNDGPAGFTDITALQMPSVLQILYDAAAFDCDGDGDVDLYLSGNQTSLLLRNNGAGTFAIAATFNSLPALQVVPADLDSDGDVDLVLATRSLLGGVDTVLVNNGTGTFTQGPVFGFGGFNGGGVAVFDHDGDGDLDLYYVGAQRLLRNGGGLQFTDVSSVYVAVPASLLFSVVAAGDLDGDGDTDILTMALTGSVDRILRNQGGVFVLDAGLPTASRTSAMALADVDRDGDLDLVRSHDASPLTLCLNDGTGSFVLAAARIPPFPIFSSHVCAADLDGDGDQEVLTCFAGGQTLLLRNRHLHLEVGAALRGQNWNVELWSEPGYAIADGLGVLAVGLVRLPSPLSLPPFGDLWLDPNGALLVTDSIPMSAGRRAFAFAIPAAPQLVGVELNVQGLVAASSGGVRLTALGIATIQ